jgi:hypothetical protein
MNIYLNLNGWSRVPSIIYSKGVYRKDYICTIYLLHRIPEYVKSRVTIFLAFSNCCQTLHKRFH